MRERCGGRTGLVVFFLVLSVAVIGVPDRVAAQDQTSIRIHGTVPPRADLSLETIPRESVSSDAVFAAEVRATTTARTGCCISVEHVASGPPVTLNCDDSPVAFVDGRAVLPPRDLPAPGTARTHRLEVIGGDELPCTLFLNVTAR